MSKASASALWLRLSPEDKELVREVAAAMGRTMDKYAQAALMEAAHADFERYQDVILRLREIAQHDESGRTSER